jgi:hypothetical protein
MHCLFCVVLQLEDNEKYEYIEMYLRFLHAFTARCSGKNITFFLASILSLTSFYSQHFIVKGKLMCGLELGVDLRKLDAEER